MSRPMPGRASPTVRATSVPAGLVAEAAGQGRCQREFGAGRKIRSAFETVAQEASRRQECWGASARPRHDMARRARTKRRGKLNGSPVSWCPIGDVDFGHRERPSSLKRSCAPSQCWRVCQCVHLNDWRLTRSGTASSRMRTSITDVLSLRIASARAWSSSPLFSTRMPAQPNARAISE